MIHRFAKLFGIWFLILGLILGLLEGITAFLVKRMDGPGPQLVTVNNPFHPFLGWSHKENTLIETTGLCTGGKTFIQTDENGFSRIPISYPDPDLNLVITGGSTIFGVGASNNDHTVPSAVAKVIQGRFKIKVNVYNLARRGYRSFQELNTLIEWLAKGRKAFIVLSVSGVNDAITGYELSSNEFSLFPASVVYGVVPIVQKVESGEFAMYNHSLALRRFSHIADWIYRIREAQLEAAAKAKPKPPQNAGDSNEMRVQLAARNYAAMAALTEQAGGKYFMFLQPTVTTKRSPTAPELQCAEKIFSGKSWPEYQRYEKEFYQRFKNLKKHFQFQDLSFVLDSQKKETFVDSCHYNDLGAEVLAKAIVARIQPWLGSAIK